MKRLLYAFTITSWLSVVCGGLQAEPVGVERLLGEMTNLKILAEYPEPAYICRQFSSYDRRSTDPAIQTDVNWFANGDCGQYLRVEEKGGRKEHVMMDIDGPGAIVRLWSANPKGVLRVYLDGSDEAAIQAPMEGFLGGRVAGFPSPITGEASKGWNSYFPIPYAKHCKVTSDEGGFYYQVNYRTYPAGTEVKTYSPDQLEGLKDKIAEAARKLGAPRAVGSVPENAYTEEFSQAFGPGEEGDLTLYGPSAIVEFMVSVDGEDRNQALRDLVFEAEFDEMLTVRCPFGDFFGSAPGINTYESLPMGVTKEGDMWAHWVMPFKSTATLRAKNLGKQEVSIKGHANYVDYKWTDRSMHFHAKWRVERDIPSRPFRDWNYLDVTGKGVYVGDALFVANPVKAWWGEGDEKIYIDGERFPSHFGTGTEDYYGYAWCNPVPFTHAYHNQTRCDGPGNYGFTAVNRWHILDAIPFPKALKFDMEAWHGAADTKVTLAQASYWYASSEAKDNYPPIKEEDVVLPKIPERKIRKVEGAIEGEQMRVIAKSGDLGPQAYGDLFSGELQLWWRNAKPGDKLVLGFPVEKAGRYEVLGEFCKAVDYGIHRLWINEERAGEPIDFYNNGVIVTGQIKLGAFTLKAGENVLAVEATGTNPRAEPKAHMFGLDYLLLKPAD